MEINEIKEIVNGWIDGDKENKSAFVVLVKKTQSETENEYCAQAGIILAGNKKMTAGVLKDIIKNAAGDTQRVQKLLLEVTLESFIELINENTEED